MNIQMFLLFVVLALVTSCSTSEMLVKVPPQKAVEIDYPDYEKYTASLKNKSLEGVEVSVLNKESGQQVRGFGLGVKAKADVTVEQGSKLMLQNNSSKTVKLTVGITEEVTTPKVAVSSKNTYIQFTLANNTAQSIPLIIPTVMNPNLSPFSKSGVSLKIGQEIFFKAKGKKRVLLVVSEDIKNGDTINVGQLLKKRKKELGLI